MTNAALPSRQKDHGAFLLNRMMIGVAADVKRFVGALIGMQPIEIDSPRELLGKGPMVLAVGSTCSSTQRASRGPTC